MSNVMRCDEGTREADVDVSCPLTPNEMSKCEVSSEWAASHDEGHPQKDKDIEKVCCRQPTPSLWCSASSQFSLPMSHPPHNSSDHLQLQAIRPQYFPPAPTATSTPRRSSHFADFRDPVQLLALPEQQSSIQKNGTKPEVSANDSTLSPKDPTLATKLPEPPQIPCAGEDLPDLHCHSSGVPLHRLPHRVLGFLWLPLDGTMDSTPSEAPPSQIPSLAKSVRSPSDATTTSLGSHLSSSRQAP
ncbi:hypothetical protein MLD38_003884 [Melastoma candidum]|uniref:Uncharacterized protein n=1 Tax=Melastoma candidum TaxID=119954 RepID=A0ACB9S742_9MYRT|nr:hypothetical protein MLD38_003884 [Melastoma candidum]